MYYLSLRVIVGTAEVENYILSVGSIFKAADISVPVAEFSAETVHVKGPPLRGHPVSRKELRGAYDIIAQESEHLCGAVLPPEHEGAVTEPSYHCGNTALRIIHGQTEKVPVSLYAEPAAPAALRISKHTVAVAEAEITLCAEAVAYPCALRQYIALYKEELL